MTMGKFRVYIIGQLDGSYKQLPVRREFETDRYNRVLAINGKPYNGFPRVLYDVEAELAKNEGSRQLQIEKLKGEGDKYIFRFEIIEEHWEKVEAYNPSPVIAEGKKVVVACLVPEKEMDAKVVAEDPYQRGPYAFYQIVGWELFPMVISAQEVEDSEIIVPEPPRPSI